MGIEQRLTRLKKEMADLEKDKARIEGSITSDLKTLKNDIGDPSLDDDEVEQVAMDMIAELKSKRKKTQKEFDQRLIEIEKMAKELGVSF